MARGKRKGGSAAIVPDGVGTAGPLTGVAGEQREKQGQSPDVPGGLDPPRSLNITAPLLIVLALGLVWLAVAWNRRRKGIERPRYDWCRESEVRRHRSGCRVVPAGARHPEACWWHVTGCRVPAGAGQRR